MNRYSLRVSRHFSHRCAVFLSVLLWALLALAPHAFANADANAAPVTDAAPVNAEAAPTPVPEPITDAAPVNAEAVNAEAAPITNAAPVTDLVPVTESRELWTGDLYSSSFRAGVCLGTDGKVRGVLLLRVPSGKVDVYHFKGEHELGENGQGNISVQHSSGHKFKGYIDSQDAVSGTIKLKNGFSVKLKAQRAHHVELTETCRPLPVP